jgi:regulator of replication initiation timing
VMSFASGLMLRVPIVEFYAGDKLAVDVLSQIRQVSTASFPVFESYSRKSIFEVAVNSFFDSPFNVKNLFIAIDWFVMNSSYAEVRLANAMTVLENLVSSNLEENDILRIPNQKTFKKFKESLQKELKQVFEKMPENSENPKITLPDIYENLANLNRRSLRQKLDILASRWSISLEDIGETRIREMIKARNLIVHEGHYNIENNNRLWEHAMVARELVIRFIFRAIGFEGNYISHLGHYHSAFFPQKTALNKYK